MDTLYNFLSAALANYWAILFAAIFLLIYKFASRRKKFLPVLPVGLLLAYLALRAALIMYPEGANPRIRVMMDVAAAASLWCAVARIAFSIFVESWHYWRRRAKIPKITRDLILAVSYAAIILIVLRTRGGVNLFGLITTSAVLTMVIGFAAQTALGNLLAGISIQLEKPFRIGEWLQYGEHIGKVIHIGWESTRLLTFDEEMVIIPNLDISKTIFKNHSQPTLMHAMKIDIGVDYEVPPNRVKKVLLDLCKQEPAIRSEPKPVVRITNYGDFAITYQMRFFYDDFGTLADVRASVMNRIWYAFRRNNIRIPFPVRDVAHRHIERRAEAAEYARLRAEAEAMFCTVPFLSPLSQEARDSISKKMSVEEYGDGEIIVKQGDPGDSLYIIHRGSCDVEVALGARLPSKVATLLPPAFFGEMSLLTGEPRSATVRAASDTTVFSIGKNIFRDVIASHPEISVELAHALARRQAETAGVVGKQKEDEDRNASKLLNRIRIFFGISA